MAIAIGISLLLLFFITGAIYLRPWESSNPGTGRDELRRFDKPPESPEWTPPNDASWKAYVDSLDDENG